MKIVPKLEIAVEANEVIPSGNKTIFPRERNLSSTGQQFRK